MTTEISRELATSIATLERTAITVTTPEEYQASAELLRAVKGRRSAVADFFRETKQKAHAAWKAICDQESSFTKRLDAVERTLKTAMRRYEEEAERKRRAEEERLRKEEAERVRLEQERLRAEAKKAETAGNEAAARNLTMQAEAVTPVPVSAPAVEVPKVAGISHRKVWRVAVTDKAALIKAAAVDPKLQVFLTVDTSLLEVAAANKDGALAVPGVRAYQDTILASAKG